ALVALVVAGAIGRVGGSGAARRAGCVAEGGGAAVTTAGDVAHGGGGERRVVIVVRATGVGRRSNGQASGVDVGGLAGGRAGVVAVARRRCGVSVVAAGGGERRL